MSTLKETWEARARLLAAHDWMDSAACKTYPTRVFYQELGAGGYCYDQARTICSSCPVKPECLNYALDINEKEGFWGGASPHERRLIQKRRLKDAI